MGLKAFISKLIPTPLMDRYVRFKRRIRWKNKSHEEIFSTIARENYWKGKESVSGVGSDESQTKQLIALVENIISNYNPQSFLDLPCGDFYWMKKVNFANCNYTGCDIVEDIIAKNTETYSSEKRNFKRINLINDQLPDADILFCRDCLVHFSENDIYKALRNICNSNIKYLVTTTFTATTKNNDIVTGHWRKINLQAAPFNFPKPLELIAEFRPEDLSEETIPFKDKSLGIWSVDQIRNLIPANA